MRRHRDRPRRWLSALKLLVLAGAAGLSIAAAVAGGAVAAATWLGAKAGNATQRARLDQALGWAGTVELVCVLAVGSLVGLGWSRAAHRWEERR